MTFLNLFKPADPEPAPKPLYYAGDPVTIWGEHVATWKRDVYSGEDALQSTLDFHGKWGKTETDRNVTMSLIVAYACTQY
jgi:hypothetical protein